jgi:excinuclease ABC subunit A
MCPTTGISYNEPARIISHLTLPGGLCPLRGTWHVNQIDINKIIPDRDLSIKKGALEPLGPYRQSLIFWQLEAIASKYKFSLSTPIKDISEDALNVVLYGSEETFKLENTPLGYSTNYFLSFEGVVNYVANHVQNQGETKEAKSLPSNIYTKSRVLNVTGQD